MAKLSLKVFKQGKPIYWIIGAVVVFVVFYFLFNKGSGSASGSTQYVSSGPSEALQGAQLQAGAAVQAAQISANVEAMRIQAQRETQTLGAQVALEQLASGENVAMAQLANERDLGAMNVNANLLINEQNLNYGAETARLAAETTLGLRMIDANIVTHQLDTNAAMFAEQSRNLIATTALGQIQGLKKKNRDEALTAITASLTGTPNLYVPQGGGGFGLGNIVGVLSPVVGLLH